MERTNAGVAALLALYVAWCGFCWLLRGGKFGELCRKWFQVEPGTTWTRIGSSFLIALPVFHWFPLLWLSTYAAMTIGYFGESMGLERKRDWPLMALWGLVVALVTLSGTLLAQSLLFAPIGLLAPLAYGLNKPLGRRWGLDWTERGEIGIGLILGTGIVLSILM